MAFILEHLILNIYYLNFNKPCFRARARRHIKPKGSITKKEVTMSIEFETE